MISIVILRQPQIQAAKGGHKQVFMCEGGSEARGIPRFAVPSLPPPNPSRVKEMDAAPEATPQPRESLKPCEPDEWVEAGRNMPFSPSISKDMTTDSGPSRGGGRSRL